MPDAHNAPLEQETAMKKKDKGLPPPFAEATKDMRFAGTFEVHVPVPDRVRPHRVGIQFETLAKAESWIHSPEGKDAIEEILGSYKK
jgi:hypothetical protein